MVDNNIAAGGDATATKPKPHLPGAATAMPHETDIKHLQTQPRWKLPVMVVLGLCFVVAGDFGLHAVRVRSGASGSTVADIHSLAILPLDNYSGDPKEDYFAEGMTDELTTDLATISQLRVISRGSVSQFTGAHRPTTAEIAKMLRVDAIVEGSVVRSATGCGLRRS